MAGMEAISYVLMGLSVAMALFGVWLLVGQRRDPADRVQSRMKGVRKRLKSYELGDSLAERRQKEEQKKAQRREAIKRQAFSDVPAIELALRKIHWAERLSGMLLQCQMPLSVTTFILLSLVLGALGVAVTIVWHKGFNPVLAVVFGGVMGLAPVMYLRIRVRARLKAFNSQFADALDLLSSSVKSGQSLNAAMQNVADEMPEPICDEFRIMSDELMFGVSFDTMLQHFMDRMSTPDVRFFCSALLIQKETGGNLSEVLDGMQRTIRERFRILAHVKTLTAQGRMSGMIVGLMPLVLCVIIYMMNPGFMGRLFTTKIGQTLLLAAGGLQLTGGFLIYKIVNIKV